MEIPTTLKHKPVIVVENYGEVDGKKANDSDAQGLSVGLAQWNDRGNVEVSAKSGAIQEKNGPVRVRNFLSTGS